MSPSTNHSGRTLGVNFLADGRADIRVWAPMAKDVSIVIGEKEFALKRQPYGYWHQVSDKLKPGDRYAFMINEDGKRRPDPASVAQPDGVHGESQACDITAFKWTDQQWKNPAISEYIFYELHTGTFTPEGTFDGITEKLLHLKELGITAVEIMPIAEFPGRRNWGYDGVFPFAAHHAYGGPEALQRLVNRCHQHGLAVVLDVVYNHLGPEGNYFPAYGPYFTDKYKTPWGSAINVDDAHAYGVRHFLIENAMMWFRDFHIDALRLDAVHAIKDFSSKHILTEMAEVVEQFNERSPTRHYLIAETDLNDRRFLEPRDKNGLGVDAQWVDEFHHALRVTTGQSKTGYYSDFHGVGHLAKSYRDAYVYDGQFSEHRQQFFGTKTNGFAGSRFVVFSQNHDQVGNRMLGERTSQLVNFDMLKVMAAATILSPYLPLIFMGEEFAEINPFLYFVEHGDPELIKAVREGRRAEFKAFHDQGEAPDPQSVHTFTQSRLQWSLMDKDFHRPLFLYYQQLIFLRKSIPSLHHLDRDAMEVIEDEKHKTLVVHRWRNQEHSWCLFNFSTVEQTITISETRPLQKKLDSGDKRWNGFEVCAQDPVSSNIISIRPASVVLFMSYHA